MSNELVATVPGDPVAQGRGRAVVSNSGHARIVDPKKSRSWKGVAQVHYQEALARAGASAPFVPEGAVALDIVAVFACPKSTPKKLAGMRRPKPGLPDADNLAKAVMDAGNALLFANDSQVTQLRVWKLYGAAGEAPFVHVTVRPIAGSVRDRVAPASMGSLFGPEEVRA